MRTPRRTILLITIILGCLCAAACAGTPEPTSPQDTRIGEVKKLADGRQVALTVHRETAAEAQARQGTLGGEYRHNTYQFTITSADGKSTELLWSIPLLNLSLIRINPNAEVRLLDACLEKGAVAILVLDRGMIARFASERSPDGKWSWKQNGYVPYGEMPHLERTLVKGQFIDNLTVQLDYKNGDMEQWQFNTGKNSTPVMVGHNDLKVKFLPASELFRTRAPQP